MSTVPTLCIVGKLGLNMYVTDILQVVTGAYAVNSIVAYQYVRS